MTLIIAVIAVLAVLGSVMWLKPSPQQQRQARLRALAQQLGLSVRLAPLPQTRRAQIRQEAVEQGVVYRLLRFDLAAPLAQDYVLVREHAESDWEVAAEQVLTAAVRRALDEVLTEVPRDAVAVELTAHGPAIYWRERGDENTVKQVHALLDCLLRALSA